MREFNTSGPCFPEIHYTILRKELIKVGKKQVEKGRYFTIFAPRQAGKTTYFELLFKEFINTNIKTIHLRFGSLATLETKRFYQVLNRRLHREFGKHKIYLDKNIQDQDDLEFFFEEVSRQYFQTLLVIDEFEGIPECVQNEFMHAIRDMYHQKEHHSLHSLILVGVSTVAELSTTSASPFNIADEIQIPYFTREEVNNLIGQYVLETGHKFDENVIKTIYQNTNGQPGLVCALCKHLVEKISTDKSKSVSMQDFYKTQDFFLTEKFDKNIMNIVSKAKNKKDFMLKLLFTDKPRTFTVDDEDIAYLFAHGVVTKDSDGFVKIPVPFYSKRLMTAFRPLINGELDHFISNAHERFDQYITDKGIDLKSIIQKYDAYVKRRGFKAFDTKNLKESACHYSLDGYMYFVLENYGGQVFAEVPSGRGRTDIMILHENKKYIIETKIFINENKFEKGKYQLVEYLKSEELSEGFYVVFSNQHKENDQLYFEENIDGKKIYTFIICTNFEIPSRIKVPEKVKSESPEKLIRIYLMYDEPDEDSVMDLEDYLFDQGFEIKTLSFDMKPAELEKFHKDYLKFCDAFIVFHNNSQHSWLNTKIIELQYLKEHKSFISAVYVTGTKEKRKERFRTREVDEVIKNFGEFSSEKIESFIEKLKDFNY